MEIFRALAVLAEPPAGPEIARIAGLLDLGESPSASEYTETFVFQLYPYASVYLGAEGMLGGEARACGPADVLPLHLREAPPVSDPRVATADEFSQSLIAPARSGFILTRADLARAARALGTGVRAGERKFVLKTLLGQDSSGVL